MTDHNRPEADAPQEKVELSDMSVEEARGGADAKGGLKLGGTLMGKYGAATGLDLDCGLNVRETFVYTKDPVIVKL